MKRLIMAALWMSVSTYSYADIIDVLSVSTDGQHAPKYFEIADDVTIRMEDVFLEICTNRVRIMFPIDANPQIEFTQADQTLVEGFVGIDSVTLSSPDVSVYSVDGKKLHPENLTIGSYIVRSGSQTYKIIVK